MVAFAGEREFRFRCSAWNWREMTDRILLGQLGANGDCLYATILARQLRHDYPGASITWAISDRSSGLLVNNPHIDEVWEIPTDRDATAMVWGIFEREAYRLYARREFDHVVLSQIWPNNLQNYDGTVRPSILRSYCRPITVPIENVIRLTDRELEKTEAFARQQGLASYRHRILFECSSRSGQSFMTPDLAQEIARSLYEIVDDATVIFSTDLPMQLADRRSRYAGALSLRETAHLTHHCTLFVGAGSGGTVAASSTASRPLPMILLLRKSTSMYASFAHDFEYFGIADRKVLEMTDENPRRIAQRIARACTEGLDAAAAENDGGIPIRFEHYFSMLRSGLLAKMRYLDAAQSLLSTAGRYGWTAELIRFGTDHVAAKLPIDPSWCFPRSRRVGEKLRTELSDAARRPSASPRQRALHRAAPRQPEDAAERASAISETGTP
jgi:hypothetical protein